jgi:hypothetical protein
LDLGLPQLLWRLCRIGPRYARLGLIHGWGTRPAPSCSSLVWAMSSRMIGVLRPTLRGIIRAPAINNGVPTQPRKPNQAEQSKQAPWKAIIIRIHRSRLRYWGALLGIN